MIHTLAKLFNPQCKDISFLQTDHDVFSVSPIAIVVQPWLGRHHVYGIFVLPEEHRLNYPILLTVRGAGKYRKEAQMVTANIDRIEQDVQIQSNYYVLRVHLKTRVALLMILRGLSAQLKDPMNWTLSYTLVNAVAIVRPETL